MTATNHAITGVLVVVWVPQPAVAVITAFGAHFVMDALPHFGINYGDELSRSSSKVFRRVLLGDLLLAGLILLALPWLLAGVVSWWLVLAGALACMSPDLVWGWHFYHEIRKRIVRPKSWFSRFHQRIQWSETPPGLIIEAAWLVSVSLLIGLQART